jgi:hypothetical protein
VVRMAECSLQQVHQAATTLEDEPRISMAHGEQRDHCVRLNPPQETKTSENTPI